MMQTSFDAYFIGNLPWIGHGCAPPKTEVGTARSWLARYGSQEAPLSGRHRNANQTGAVGGVSFEGQPPLAVEAYQAFDAVIAFDDGSCAPVTATLSQLANGDVYWMPELSDSADLLVISVRPIVSLTLHSVIYAKTDEGQSQAPNPRTWDFVCFAEQTKILTARGEVAVQDLQIGDRVQTLDNGLQPLRWIGHRRTHGTGRMAPVTISKGVLNAHEDLLISPQHRVFVNASQAEAMFSETELLATAKHLKGFDGIYTRALRTIVYYNLLFDNHEVIWANGVLAESLHLSDQGVGMLGEAARAEVIALFPELDLSIDETRATARPVLRGFEATLLERLAA